ncbi:hypothetical protein LKI_03130 [Leuconostoc kimchii IMSNU 11154]|uniref:Uncharacterized protein n=1 Tax=Leuconostoc kimchii (strain IMSNU 11154 / KCTC 2386 / IH25) TaxID=762051 RepID=D5T1L9_LEUKI|nr:hypothetical protein LKI_03130 [Leuconostoc kimchii IMSNU 11154]
MHVEDLYPIAKNITLKYQLDNNIPGIQTIKSYCF